MDVHLKNLFSRFQDQFGSGPGLGPGSATSLQKVDGVDLPFIKSLYRAAASLYRSNPWRRLRPGHLLGVRVGKDQDWYGRRQPFPCVQFIGGDGGNLGIHMFKSQDDARKMTGPRETIRVPNVEVLRVTYDPDTVASASHKRMVKSLGLERAGEDRLPVFDVGRCTATGGLEFRNPTAEELRFAYGVMKAVCLVHPLLVVQDDGKCPGLGRLEAFIETVDIQWPSEMVRGNDLAAVAVSHPPHWGYEEEEKKKTTTTTTTSAEQSEEVSDS